MIASRLLQISPRRSYSSKALKQFKDELSGELKAIKEAGTWKLERVITGMQGPSVKIEGTSGNVLNFCANNYLGLSSDPSVIKACKNAMDKYGAGLSSVRFICGTQDSHLDLEKKIAKFHNRDDAILYASCFDANAGLFEQILNDKDAVLSDELNHASIIDGIRLCKAKKFRYKHKDMNDLEEKLKQCGGMRRKLIVSDGVFSMDGNVAPLPKIMELADKYDCLTFLDEAHATGVIGKTGRGTEEYLSTKPVTIINSTLGKAIGGASGGYTTGPQEIVTLLRQRSRTYLFSNSLPPPVVASAAKVFDMLLSSSEYTKKLQAGTKHFRTSMEKAGFTIMGENHPICPVFIGDAKVASQLANKMIAEGIYVTAFSYPVVPMGKARIRVQIIAAHSKENIDKLINAFIKIGKELKVI